MIGGLRNSRAEMKTGLWEHKVRRWSQRN